MAKFYVSSGNFNMLVSKGNAGEAAMYCSWFTNPDHILDEHFYVDERGFRDYITADPKTAVFKTENIFNENIIQEDEDTLS